MITAPKREFHFVGTCPKSNTLRRITVKSHSAAAAEKAASARLINPQIVPKFS